MSNLVSYAEKELDRIGMTEEDEYNGAMRKHILHMVKSLQVKVTLDSQPAMHYNV